MMHATSHRVGAAAPRPHPLEEGMTGSKGMTGGDDRFHSSHDSLLLPRSLTIRI